MSNYETLYKCRKCFVEFWIEENKTPICCPICKNEDIINCSTSRIDFEKNKLKKDIEKLTVYIEKLYNKGYIIGDMINEYKKLFK